VLRWVVWCESRSLQGSTQMSQWRSDVMPAQWECRRSPKRCEREVAAALSRSRRGGIQELGRRRARGDLSCDLKRRC
jgi:hypothetical protein